MTRARPRVESVPEKIVAPKMRSNAETRRRYSLPPFAHAERIQHLGCRVGFETDRLALLANGQRRKKDSHESVLVQMASQSRDGQ
jgi:hypothetical protein